MLDLDSLKVNEHCHLQATILKAAWLNFFFFFLQTYCTHIHDSFTDRFLFLGILLHLRIIYNPNMPYFVFVFCSSPLPACIVFSLVMFCFYGLQPLIIMTTFLEF